MADLRLRPRFKRDLDVDARSVLECLRATEMQGLGGTDVGAPKVSSSRHAVSEVFNGSEAIRTQVLDLSVVIRVPAELERTWSPQLEVSFEERSGGDGCTMHGLFGPRPSIWTSFVAGYLFFLCAGFVGFMFGMTSYWLGMDARMLWVVPGAAIGMVAVFLVGHFGRRVGSRQMSSLHQFLEQTIRDCREGVEG